MSGRVVGYLVLVVPCISDTQVVFPTWKETIARASSLAESDSMPISLLRANSQEDCVRGRNIKIYELSDGTAIYAQAVFAPTI